MTNMFKKIKNKKGFTLIELIVVIAILAILALIAIPRLSGFQERARESADISEARNVSTSVSILRANETIAQGTYVLTGAPAAGSDLADIQAQLGGTWPVPQAAAAGAAANAVYTVVIDANDAATVTTNTAAPVQLFPVAAGAYAN